MKRRWPTKISIVLIIFCLASFLVAWEDKPRTLEVYLKHTSLITGATLTLQDVIQSSAGNAGPFDFSSIRLPYTEGRFGILSTVAVRQAVQSAYSGPLIVVGQRIFVIPADGIDPGTAWFYEALLEFISTQIPQPRARIEVEIAGRPTLAGLKPGALSFAIGSTALRNGIKVGAARLSYQGGRPGSFGSDSLDIVMHVVAPVAVPALTIPAGERFQDDALREQEEDLARFTEDVLFYDRAAGSFTASQILAAGEPIPLKKIARTMFVRAGDKISITFIRKNMTVGVRGRALGSGSLDDQIAVKLDTGNRRFQGKVTGDREVLIELY